MNLNLSFRSKIVLFSGVAVVGFTMLLALTIWQLREHMLGVRQQQLASAVQSAHTIVEGFVARASKGEMSVPAAQAAARDALRAARYGEDGSGYIYIYTMDGVNVLLPAKPEWEGQKILGRFRDANGHDTIAVILDALRKSTAGYTFVDTQFPRPGQTTPVDKLQYVANVKAWNWFVGSGLYMDDVQAAVRLAVLKATALGGLFVAALALFGVWIASSVLRQIGGDPAVAMGVMHEVARGNLNVALGKVDEGSLLHAIDSTVSSWRDTVGNVRDAIENITSAAGEIAVGNLDLSVRTEQAAANLEETAAAMEQLKATITNTAHATDEANSLAEMASFSARRGNEVVTHVVTTMEQIQGSSRRIAEIVGVIDSIAFQTNILALNAAVEAARAGEQGRGFAVVAGEVRTLAQRSATAAKEIHTLIGESVRCVEAGSGLVGEAGQAIGVLVDNVGKVGTLVTEIASSASEQASGVSEVNVAVARLDEATQQNAALVEQASAAAESLKEQAAKLRDTIALFQI